MLWDKFSMLWDKSGLLWDKSSLLWDKSSMFWYKSKTDLMRFASIRLAFLCGLKGVKDKPFCKTE